MRVNEDFAAEFAKREQKRLSARGKALGVEDSDGDESSSESEDEDAVELTRGMDVKILETINAIRRKDPKIYDKDAVFFDEAVAAERLSRYSCLVWTEGMGEWLPIEDAPGLVDVLVRYLGE